MSVFTLSGTQDGSNKTFTASGAFASGTAQLIYNGRIYPRADTTRGLTENSSTSITLISAPASDDVIELLGNDAIPTGTGYTAPNSRARLSVQEVSQAASQLLYAMAEVDAVVQTVSGTPTFAIYVNGGATVLASGNATNTAGVLSASFSAADTSVFAYNQLFRCIFTFYVSGITAPFNREVYFTVARVVTEDACPININDMKGLHSRLDAALTQLGQAADAVDRYILPAWREIRRKLQAATIEVHTVSPQTLVDVVRYWAGVNCCYGIMAGSSDYQVVADFFQKRFDQAWKDLVIIHRPADQLEGIKDRGTTSQVSMRVGPDTALNHPNLWGPFAIRNGGPFGGIR